MFTVQHQSMGNMDAGNPCWPCLWQSGVLIFWHWYLIGPVSLELSFPHCPPPTARALGFRLIAVWILPWVSSSHSSPGDSSRAVVSLLASLGHWRSW